MEESECRRESLKPRNRIETMEGGSLLALQKMSRKPKT